MTALDFGDRVTGREVDPLTFHSYRDAKTISGVIITLFSQAPRVFRIRTAEGLTHTVKVTR